MPIEIRPFVPSPQGLEEAATLLRSAFPEAKHFNAAHLDWNYLGNPDGKALAFNAYDAEELVAHFASSPMRARIFGREEMGLLTQHAVTKPRYEGKGLFKTLVEATMKAGAEAGYGHAIAMANANSVFAFVKRLGFEYVCHLDVRVGVGPSPRGAPDLDVDFDRVWTPEALKWRLSRPDDPYRARRVGDRMITYANSGILGIQVELGTFPIDLVEPGPPDLRTRNPGRVWIGLDPGRQWRFRPYVNLPVRLRPTPLNFTIRDLTCQQRHFRRGRILLDALDFDAY